MSDPIRGVGGSINLGALEGAGGGAKVGGAREFQEALGEVVGGGAQGVGGARGVQEIVGGVAERLHRGELSDMGHALEVVVDEVVDAQFAGLPEQTRARMAEDLKEVLFSDPFFVLEVEGLLQRAVDGLA